MTKARVYCWPKFGKGILGRGMGFGNRLLPWARCRIFSRLHRARMISPIWVRPAVGQLFRGGIDYRNYLRQLVLLGLFQSREGDVGLAKGALLSLGARIREEPDDLQSTQGFQDVAEDTLVLFQGLGRYFEPLKGWSSFLADELVAITQSQYMAVAGRYPSVPIGMCIRCGNDFDPVPTDRDILRPGEKTPIRWFVQGLRAVRRAAGYPAEAFIVSDGTAHQLKELLEMDGVHLVRPGSAISDLLVMARSKVLLASGSSSFAAWGAFLGQMPTASHPGQSMTKEWCMAPERGQFLSEFQPETLHSPFLEQASIVLEAAARERNAVGRSGPTLSSRMVDGMK